MKKAASKATTNAEILSRNQRKWGKDLWAAGWVGIPAVFLQRQRALGLEPLDLNIFLQIAKHWWEADNPPYPSKAEISYQMDVNPRTVQRRIACLKAAGFITTEAKYRPDRGQTNNIYRFDGLIKAAKPHAQELLEESEDRKRKKAERLKRKRARLKLVKAI